MPKGDGTGPMGMGQMTGRRAGYCAGYNSPGFANPTIGGGRGMGRGAGWRGNFNRGVGMPWSRGAGWGMAWRRGLGPGLGGQAPINAGAPQMTTEEEKEYLKTELANIENEKADIKKRLEELS